MGPKRSPRRSTNLKTITTKNTLLIKEERAWALQKMVRNGISARRGNPQGDEVIQDLGLVKGTLNNFYFGNASVFFMFYVLLDVPSYTFILCSSIPGVTSQMCQIGFLYGLVLLFVTFFDFEDQVASVSAVFPPHM